MTELKDRWYIIGVEPKPHSFLDVYSGLKEKNQEDIVSLARLRIDSIAQTSSGNVIKRII